MEYDYDLFKTYIINILKKNYPKTSDREIGKNISILQNVKIIFDGYSNKIPIGDNDFLYKEQGNKNIEGWVMFVHKDALTENFVFPEHQKIDWPEHPEGLPDWQIVRRPDEEVCLWTWYDKENDSWDVLTLEERMEVNNTLTEQIVMNVLEGLNNSLT